MKPTIRLAVVAVLAVAPFASAAPPATRPAAAPAATPERAVPNVPGVKAAQPVKALNFDEIALTDAIEYFRDITGANINVDWKALQEVGLGKDTPVSLRLRGVKVGVALQKTLDAAGAGLLAFYVDQNVINVTTRALADERMITRVYAVEDLLTEVPNYGSVPEFSVSGNGGGSRTAGASRGGGGGSGGGSSSGVFGGGGGGSGTTTTDQRKTRAERGDELIDLIQTTIRPDVWNVNGGKAAIRFTGGKLVVTAPLDVHKAIGG
jgi:hypothetical protein